MPSLSEARPAINYEDQGLTIHQALDLTPPGHVYGSIEHQFQVNKPPQVADINAFTNTLLENELKSIEKRQEAERRVISWVRRPLATTKTITHQLKQL